MRKGISLYECSNAHVLGEYIYCTKEHNLGGSPDDKVLTVRLKRGKPLVFRVCSLCQDFDRNGEPVEPSERGWVGIAAYKTEGEGNER